MPENKTEEQIAAEVAAKAEADKAPAEAAAKDEAEAALKAKPANIDEVVAKLEGIVAALSQKKEAHEKRIAELAEKLSAAEKNYAEAKVTIEKAEAAKKYADLENKVDSLVGEKKLMPSQKASVMKLLSEIPLNKSYKEGELESTVETLLFSIFKQNAASTLNTKEQTGAGEKIAADDEVAQINKIAKDKGLSYKEAYKVWKQNTK